MSFSKRWHAGLQSYPENTAKTVFFSAVAAARARERKSFAAPSARHAPESAKTKSIANAAKNAFIAVENCAYFLVSNWKTVRVL